MNNRYMNQMNDYLEGGQGSAPRQNGAFANMVPRQTMIRDQPHMLAYINPTEEQMLRDMGGSGMPGPDGVPAYDHNWLHSGAQKVGGAISSGVDYVKDAYDFITNDNDLFANIGGDYGDPKPEYDLSGTDTTDATTDATAAVSPTTANAAATAELMTPAQVTAYENLQSGNYGSGMDQDWPRYYADGGRTLSDITTKLYEDSIAANQNEGAAFQPDYQTDANGQAALDTLKEISTGGSADTLTYNTTENNATENNNTIFEKFANTFTPNDGKTYVDSVLVNTSDAIDATVGANDGAKYDAETGKITLTDGSNIGIGTNVNVDDITNGTNVNVDDTANGSINVTDAYEQYADTLLEAGLSDVGGKQIADDADNAGNPAIITWENGEATVTGALYQNSEVEMATNADGTLHVPYDGKDPHAVDATTKLPGSTDPNSADYNMSLDLATTGSFVDLDGNTVTDDAFETELPTNGAAILNVLGTDQLVKTGDDSKMIVGSDGVGYEYTDGTVITDEIFEEAVEEAISDGLLSPDILSDSNGEYNLNYDPTGTSGTPSLTIEDDNDSLKYRNVFNTRDQYGDFYGGRSGGMWDRFRNSYLTRFGYSPEGFDEMIRKVENPDGSVNFFGADGALINPESLGSNYRLTGDGTSLKIGEYDVNIGQQTLDDSGNVVGTTYSDYYDPELDKDILAPNLTNYNLT